MPFVLLGNDATSPHLLEHLRTLSQMQLRTDVLGIQVATLRRLLAGNFVLVEEAADDWSGRGAIVVAHDHLALRSIAAEMLEGLGYRVFATDHRMGEWPDDFAIDAILLDVPLVNQENVARVRTATQKSPRVVVTTVMPEGSGRQRLREAGVVGFVSWPLDRRELAECLRRVLTTADACSS